MKDAYNAINLLSKKAPPKYWLLYQNITMPYL